VSDPGRHAGDRAAESVPGAAAQPAPSAAAQPVPPARPVPGAEIGRQRERTRLAWLRTVLAATAVSLLSARLAVGTGPTRDDVPAATALAALWLTVVVICRARMRVLGSPGSVRASRSTAALALVVVGYALLGALVTGLRRW
jgi:hypothetical protein